jgi:hypothetical protein
MNECVALVEEEPRECLEAWARSPETFAARLDARHGVDPTCGTCLFVFGACVPCGVCAPCLAASIDESWSLVCCCPWLIGWKSLLEVAGDDLV